MTMNVVSGIPQAVNGHRHTFSSMTEEWRVSLVVGDHGGAVKGSHYRDLLRARLGDDVTVSAGKMHLFLYAGSAKAAEEAGQMALAVLEGKFTDGDHIIVDRDPKGELTFRKAAEPALANR